MFDENSQIVRTWVRLVSDGICAKDQVPKLFNLREVVSEILDSLA